MSEGNTSGSVNDDDHESSRVGNSTLFDLKPRKLVYDTSVSVGYWCVNKLLNVSKSVEHLTGAEIQRTHSETKSNGNTTQTNGGHNSTAVKLSRPVNQIIEDSFQEVFSNTQNQKNSLQLDTIKPGSVRNLLYKWESGKNLSYLNDTSSGCSTPRSTDSSIQSTHKEILNTLELLLTNTEDLKRSILGNRRLSSYNKMDRIAQNDQVRVLTLNDKEHQDCTLYRLKKKWVVQFRMGPSLLGRNVSLFCNYPKDGEEFQRNKYYEFKWAMDEGCDNADDTALHINIRVNIAGSFHYYFTYAEDNNIEHQGSGFFLIDPTLKYGNGEVLPLDCIQCQTVLAKSLGRFDNWEAKLRVTKESGYNMIHFTPIQELGESNSSYSIKEQLKLNPLFDGKNMVSFEDVDLLLKKIRKDWKLTSICDIVLNHTANESLWLIDHPEATYNCGNCKYMRPAYLLDAALSKFSQDIKNGMYDTRGIPTVINNEEHLNSIRHFINADVLANIKLQEMYICDVYKLVAEFLLLARNRVPSKNDNNDLKEELKIIQDPDYKRLASRVDMQVALRIYNIYRSECFDEETRIKTCSELFKAKLDELNNSIINSLNDDLKAAVENCISSIRYFRVQNDGPRISEISKKDPLFFRYFTDYDSPKTLADFEELLYGSNSRYLMAHNGWVMNSDPLHNFAGDSKVYLRRELIAWSDSVKLRYGNCPDDSPYLWSYMREYVDTMAKMFDGVRLDNCHSTPIPVAEYLLDSARKVNPELYVVAELFTNSDQKDNIFVNRLGITSLIREAMSAWNSHEQGRLVHRYGGTPVGAFYQPNTRPFVPSIAHAMFLDLSHDNPSPIEKRSVFDLLPSSALVNMACCASGSNRGYDELVPHHIHVVDETREYAEWSSKDSEDLRYVSKSSGIIGAKRALNDLHFYLGSEGYEQVYVDQINENVVAVTRHNPITHDTVILVAYTAFSHPESNSQKQIKPLKVEGELEEIIFEATMRHKISSRYDKIENYKQDNKYINGYFDYEVVMKEHIALKESTVFNRGNSGDVNVLQLDFKDFMPGSVVAIKVRLFQKAQNAVKSIRDLLGRLSRNEINDLTDAMDNLSLADVNIALYRCDQEERDEGKGFDAYNIPNFGPMAYCGLQGVMSLLSNIRANNDLGHPLCGNLRDGNWLIEYNIDRLKVYEGTKNLGLWMERHMQDLKQIPRYLIPAYYASLITHLYMILMDHCYKLMSNFVQNGSTFVRALSLGSVQFGAFIKSSPLPALSPKLSRPTPSTVVNSSGVEIPTCISLSAGLPHFSKGYTRNWGRDTFIALHGLFLLTGRYQEARYHILGYAACLRHGLIPNLLDGGRNARFNCRDAVWWWLYCIQLYVQKAPNGEQILKDSVSRIYPNDDSPPQTPGTVDQPLYEVMQESLKVHFQGLTFRERNAGKQIDEHMTDRGFNNQIGVHPETGFVFGGNEFNCGTWMDKMGSSEKAGNKGKPATPRDGSAVELVGLSKSVISWLSVMYNRGLYPYVGVERVQKNGSKIKWAFAEWADKIQKNFEKHFWIGPEPNEGLVVESLVNHRGIYKDCYGASQKWTDYQLRCNFPIAMVAAPELFEPQHAWTALNMATKHLLGPLGMKTLDSSDWNYCGDYDNSNDSSDSKISHGFNYHQGPEWVWPVGYFLRARLIFAKKLGFLQETIASTKQILANHFIELQTSAWRGLPELTNTNGTYCNDSSRTQAWSMSSILEILHDLQMIESKETPHIN